MAAVIWSVRFGKRRHSGVRTPKTFAVQLLSTALCQTSDGEWPSEWQDVAVRLWTPEAEPVRGDVRQRHQQRRASCWVPLRSGALNQRPPSRPPKDWRAACCHWTNHPSDLAGASRCGHWLSAAVWSPDWPERLWPPGLPGIPNRALRSGSSRPGTSPPWQGNGGVPRSRWRRSPCDQRTATGGPDQA